LKELLRHSIEQLCNTIFSAKRYTKEFLILGIFQVFFVTCHPLAATTWNSLKLTEPYLTGSGKHTSMGIGPTHQVLMLMNTEQVGG
jgi:hypothetical protein